MPPVSEARDCSSFPAGGRELRGSWAQGGCCMWTWRISLSSDPPLPGSHIFTLCHCLSPLSPPLMTAATAPLRNYLLATLIVPCGSLTKIASPHPSPGGLLWASLTSVLPVPRAAASMALPPPLGNFRSLRPFAWGLHSHPQPMPHGVLKCTGVFVLFRYDEAHRRGAV